MECLLLLLARADPEVLPAARVPFPPDTGRLSRVTGAETDVGDSGGDDVGDDVGVGDGVDGGQI